jgi:hypothetical protein
MSSCSFPKFETLRTEEFDLVIVSAWLGEWDRGVILSTARKAPALVLTELTLADKVLAQMERMLVAASQESDKGMACED